MDLQMRSRRLKGKAVAVEVPSVDEKSNSKAADEKPKRRGIKDSKSKSEAAGEKPKRRGRSLGSQNLGN